jgi:Tfp pilus assembly protein PilV
MKKYILLSALAILAMSCTNNEAARQIIIGKWKYDTQAILESTRTRNDISNNEIQMVEGTMALYATAVFDFQEDGTLQLDVNGTRQMGTWKLSANAKVLYLNLSGQDQPNDIAELTEQRIVLPYSKEEKIMYTRILIPAE